MVEVKWWWWWWWESIFIECLLGPIIKRALQIGSTYHTNPVKKVMLSPLYKTGSWAQRAPCTQVEPGAWYWAWAWVKSRFKTWVQKGKVYVCVCACVCLIHALLYFLPVRDKRFKSLRELWSHKMEGSWVPESLCGGETRAPLSHHPQLTGTTIGLKHWIWKLTFLFAGVTICLGHVRGHRERQLWLDGTFHMVPKIHSLAWASTVFTRLRLFLVKTHHQRTDLPLLNVFQKLCCKHWRQFLIGVPKIFWALSAQLE